MESEATSIRRLFFLDLILEDHSLGLGAILQVANRSFPSLAGSLGGKPGFER